MPETFVAVMMGSDSDLPVMESAIEILRALGVRAEVRVLSAHRSPEDTQAYVRDADGRGCAVFIAAAGLAAHLAGAVAAVTVKPVIGVPMAGGPLGGFDALLSTVQMPGGVPVACVAIGKAGARNAGYLAAEVLALADGRLTERLRADRAAMAEAIRRKNVELVERYPPRPGWKGLNGRDRRMHGWDLVRAARALAGGGVIAYPTEAVFGIGCDPWNETALLCLARLKRRPLCKGFIVIAGAHEDLSGLVTFPDAEVRGRVLATWPGPVTWVLPVCPGVSRRLTGGRRDLAVRVTAHPVAAALCRRVGPLVSTSANPAACVPAASAARVRGYFRAGLDYLVPGEVGGARSVSEVRDALSGAVLRPASDPGGARGH